MFHILIFPILLWRWSQTLNNKFQNWKNRSKILKSAWMNKLKPWKVTGTLMNLLLENGFLLGEEAVRELGMDMYTLLYLKWVNNRDLLYSTWNSAQCYVASWMGEEFGGEWIHVYVWLSPFAVHLKLSQHCLLIGYTPIQNQIFKIYVFSFLGFSQTSQDWFWRTSPQR